VSITLTLPVWRGIGAAYVALGLVVAVAIL
jgi:hypothetical protein